MPNDFKPLVKARDTDIAIGSSIRLGRLYDYLDLDGNEQRLVRVTDVGHDPQGGYFTYRGKRLNAGQTYTFNMSQARYVKYNAGLVEGQELFRVQAYDGKFWSDSDGATLYSLRELNAAPKVKFFNPRSVANESYSIARYLRARDPDGDAVKSYRFRYANANGAYLTFRGEKVAAGKVISVRKDRLHRLRVETNSFKNSRRIFTLEAAASDGREWGSFAKNRFNIVGNRKAPTIRVYNPELRVGKTLAASNFLQFSDADSNTAKEVAVYDTGIRGEGGYFKFRNRRLAAREWHTIAIEDLGDLRYVAAQQFDREKARFRVSDGRYWSDVGTGTVTTYEVPVIKVDDKVILDDLEEVRLSDLFQQVDEGPLVQKYRFYDGNTDNRSARFFDGRGNRLAQGQVLEFTRQEFEQITIRGGEVRKSLAR